MAKIHDHIRTLGTARALEHAKTENDRFAIDCAASILAEEEESIGITYAGWCLTALPHRRISDLTWKRESHKITLLVASGHDQDETPIGVPYGPTARLILIYLQTQAIRANSRKIELGRSLNDWTRRMGLSRGGRTFNTVREQARRISTCSITFFWNGDGKNGGSISGRRNDYIVSQALQLKPLGTEDQPALWEDEVELSETFFEHLKAHPVPIREQALRLIAGRSQAIDIYAWLTYRLHSLSEPRRITWLALKSQFGQDYSRVRRFRERFCDSLALALAVYPEARVDVEDFGLVLHPSRPPIDYERPRLVT